MDSYFSRLIILVDLTIGDNSGWIIKKLKIKFIDPRY